MNQLNSNLSTEMQQTKKKKSNYTYEGNNSPSCLYNVGTADKITGCLMPKLVVKSGINGMGLFTTVDIKKEVVILELNGYIINSPTQTSIQLAENSHVEHPVGSYINHNCNPNSTIDKDFVVSLRNIQAGEEITFNYNDNEDKLAFPFECTCCGKKIFGRMAYPG